MISGKQQEIPLKGLTSTLSDYDCPDGDLMICHNLVNNGAGLQPIQKPSVLTDDDGKKLPALPSVKCLLVFSHKTSRETVYIIHDSTTGSEKFRWARLGDTSWTTLPGTLTDGELSAVGNILIISSDNGLNYFRWNLENNSGTGGYDYLGDSSPDINIKFSSAVGGDAVTIEKQASTDVFKYDDESSLCFYATKIHKNTEGIDYDLTDSVEIEDGVFAAYNFVQNQMFKQGRFIAPFLVRYAYKMYDGNYIMQSSPVLIVPSSNEIEIMAYYTSNTTITAEQSSPYVSVDILKGEAFAITQFLPTYLKYAVEGMNSLAAWKDVIQEVCIFATPPISKYTNTGKLKFTEETSKDISFVGVGGRQKTTHLGLQPVSYVGCVKGYDIKLPSAAGSTKDIVESASQNFHLLRSFSIEELQGATSGVLKPKANYDLSLFNTDEALTDGYRARSIYYPKFIHAYNNRLNMAGLSIDERSSLPDGMIGDYQSGSTTINAYVYINEEGVWSKVTCAMSSWCSLDKMAGYFYYPNPNAKYLQIGQTYIKLTTHPFLNGAYYFNTALVGLEGTTTAPTLPTTFSGKVPHPNWVMTSEVDNPFLFPALGVNAVGSGDILALSTATKAMSEGTAFGTHPLYVFTTEGIYPMGVGDTGLFVSVGQPVSREMPFNKDAILQIDNSVIFLCERGLMQLDGGRTTLLSTDLQSRFATIEASLDIEKWTDIMKKFYDTTAVHNYLEAYQFMSYIKNARLAFDYANYRIYVYDPTQAVAFIYNIGTKTWSSVDCSLKASVIGYPSTLLNYTQVINGTTRMMVGRFDQSATELVDSGKGFYVTRPMKFKLWDILKTVRRVIQRGVLNPDNDSVVSIFGSRDFINWTLLSAKKGNYIPRLSGTPYDAFIVAGWVEMDKDMNSVSRLTLEVKEKYMNKPR